MALIRCHTTAEALALRHAQWPSAEVQDNVVAFLISSVGMLSSNVEDSSDHSNGLKIFHSHGMYPNLCLAQ